MLKTIDLFAGAGGLSLGFKQTGHFKLVAAAEIKEYARETYRHNIPDPGEEFVFIENVVGYDFKSLSRRFDGIDGGITQRNIDRLIVMWRFYQYVI